LAQPKVHPRAIVDPKAVLHDDVEIGPNAVIEAGVEVGAGTRIIANAYVYGGTKIGARNEIHPGAVLGGSPQDKRYKGEASFLRIGDDNQIRECVTISRATGEGNTTVIGNRNMLLNYAHVGHNAEIADDCIIEGAVMVAGHVKIADRVLLAGLAGVHQFCRIGRLAMIGFAGGISQDLPPFMTAVGSRPFYVMGPNIVGLRRAGVAAPARAAIKRAYKLLCRTGLPLGEVLADLEKDPTPEVQEIVAFVRASKRGVVRRGGRAARGGEAEGGADE
jgi:UDP-N-acetylglucosamine acyltransferase